MRRGDVADKQSSVGDIVDLIAAREALEDGSPLVGQLPFFCPDADDEPHVPLSVPENLSPENVPFSTLRCVPAENEPSELTVPDINPVPPY